MMRSKGLEEHHERDQAGHDGHEGDDVDRLLMRRGHAARPVAVERRSGSPPQYRRGFPLTSFIARSVGYIEPHTPMREKQGSCTPTSPVFER
jgi:hypothetical protein